VDGLRDTLQVQADSKEKLKVKEMCRETGNKNREKCKQLSDNCGDCCPISRPWPWIWIETRGQKRKLIHQQVERKKSLQCHQEKETSLPVR